MCKFSTNLKILPTSLHQPNYTSNQTRIDTCEKGKTVVSGVQQFILSY